MDAYELKPGNVLECLGCREKFKVEKLVLTRIVSGTDHPTLEPPAA
jgi:hypothetical protein